MGTGRSRVEESHTQNVPESALKSIHINSTVYYWIILIVSIIAIIGNLCVIRSVSFRKYKYLQKTCMISLAVSDILTVVTFSINYLDVLGKPRDMVWSTGEFLCWYNPLGQVLGNLASSMALLVIALDRYHSVIYAVSPKWNPELWKCIKGAIILWGICFGIAYPMSTFYFHLPARIESSGENVYFCVGTNSTRGVIKFYYVSVALLFFLPLITMFVWFYYKIAILLWKLRKPVSSKGTRIEEPDNTSSSKSFSHCPSSPVLKNALKHKKNPQMQRKIRTFRIVIVLILAFNLFRMPYWVFWLVKLLSNVKATNAIWRTTLIFTVLNLVNCAMNPFLYTYLNQTIYICLKVHEFVYRNCCCCFSNDEFQEYENGTHTIYEGVLGPPIAAKQESEKRAIDNPSYEKFPSSVPQFPKYTSVDRF
ncbi:QRFP-like peptide receptor [Euwallacea fornicatus]|uniref:QRFP-like peptide receptor n=1 Tax=Euwallacea fornicatus TaxID=995702 RepID=UPI00338E8B72